MPNGPADVLGGAPNPGSYTDNGDGTVTDKVTGLMWQQTVPTTVIGTWSSAVAYCPTLTLGGHADWRLPSIAELSSIVDYGVASPGPTINSAVFPGAEAGGYWSSTRVANSAYALVWLVLFDKGEVGANYATTTASLRCVR